MHDAIVIGSGPNGLAAGITLQQAGLSVLMLEAKKTIGGGMRSAELTLPGFTHDICSAIHPLAKSSPFFRALPLHKYGLKWIYPSAPLAHPLDGGTALFLERSLEQTAHQLNVDAAAYKKIMQPFVNQWQELSFDLLAPFHLPKHFTLLLRFLWYALRSADGLACAQFLEEQAKTLFAGLAAHSIMPLDKRLTAAFGLVLGILGHVTGWPIPEGGSQNIANALAGHFVDLGGVIQTDMEVKSLRELPQSKLVMCDITPRQMLKIGADYLPLRYKRSLEKYRYGPGVFKVDWALNHPIPWTMKDVSRAGTVHLGGSWREISQSESDAWQGRISRKPYIILAQPSLFDATRAPAGKHTAWGYCHVPHGSDDDMTEIIENQIERFAPGFRECIIAKHTFSPKQLEQHNANYIGGDINGGVQDLFQLFTRPVCRMVPYATPVKGLYFCSSSTPPGGGVHGMCGFHAAKAALKAL